MKSKELQEILKKHKKWLKHREGGERADLTGADLTGADLNNAILTGTNLVDTILDKSEEYRLGRILDKAIIGYKKCRKDIIVKLRIPKGAVVFGINGNTFRTNKAKVISISGNSKKAVSNWDKSFIYETGKTYTIKDFSLMYNDECGKGIHFFKTEDEAKKY